MSGKNIITLDCKPASISEPNESREYNTEIKTYAEGNVYMEKRYMLNKSVSKDPLMYVKVMGDEM